MQHKGGVGGRFNWRCHTYCLMSNHYHLLVETLDGNLSKSILAQKEPYLLELARYIVLNPVRVCYERPELALQEPAMVKTSRPNPG